MELNITDHQSRDNSSLPRELLAVYVPINLFILVSNVLVLLTFIRLFRRGKLEVQHFYLFGLVGTDFMTLVINAVSAVLLAKGDLQLTKEHCDALGIASTSFVSITAFIHCSMCLDRIALVQLPLKYNTWKKDPRFRLGAIIVICCCYVIPITVNLICRYAFMIDTGGFNFEPDMSDCVAHDSNANNKRFGLIMLSVLLLIMLIQLISCITVIWRVVKFTQVTRSQILKAVRVQMTTIGLFYLCFIPGAIWVGWQVDNSTGKPPKGFTFFAVEMIALNSGLSFCIYYTMLPEFKKTLKVLFQCR